MTDSLLLMLALGRRMDSRTLHAYLKRARQRREDIFTKVADVLFGLVMLFLQDLSVLVRNSSGALVDPSDSSVTDEDRINAAFAALASSDRAKRFREFLRPVIVGAAMFIADMLGPDEHTLSLMTSQLQALPDPAPAAAAAALPPAPAAAPQPTAPAPAPRPPVPTGYEGKLLQVQGNPSVWHIVNGHKQGIQAPDVMRTVYHSVHNGRTWSGVEFVPQSVIDAFPDGPPEHSTLEGKLLQVPGNPSVWHIVNGKRQGLTSPEALTRRYGSHFVNGRWSGVLYVPAEVVNDFPIGPSES